MINLTNLQRKRDEQAEQSFESSSQGPFRQPKSHSASFRKGLRANQVQCVGILAIRASKGKAQPYEPENNQKLFKLATKPRKNRFSSLLEQ